MATVTKRGKTYLLRVYAGYDVNGKQIEKTKTWTPPLDFTVKQAEKEARHQAELFEEAIRTGALATGKMRFAAFAELWLSQYAERNLRPRTVAGYRALLERIIPVIGHIPLEKIRPTNILEFYSMLEKSEPGNAAYKCAIDLKAKIRQMGTTKAALAQSSGVSLSTLSAVYHRKAISRLCAEKICRSLDLPLNAVFNPVNSDKTISPATIQHYHHLISDILETAVKWQYIPYNPCTRVSAPKSPSSDILYLDDIQARQLLKLLTKEPGYYRRAVELLLLTGMRRGELMGLEWQDIDWKRKTIRITRTSQYIPGKGVYTDSTKNESSKRIIYISSETVNLLQEQAAWQQEQRQVLKNAWYNSPRIITTPEGKPMRPDRLTQWFNHFIKKTDLPQIHLHSLRHTYATLCITSGVPITAVAAQLGHANVATTTAIYAHAIQSAQISAADQIGKLFEEIL